MGWGLTRDGQAMSPIVGVVLMVAVVIAIVAVTGVLFLGFADEVTEPAPVFAQESSVAIDIANASITDQSLVLTHRGGDTVSIEALEVLLDTDATTVSTTPSAPGDDDGDWSTGETLTVPLNTSTVCTGADTVALDLVYQTGDGSHIVGSRDIPVEYGGFTIRNGSVVPVSQYTATATVLGTGLTYGSPGPNIPIFLTFQIGATTAQPWSGNLNNPNNPRTHTFRNQPAGAPIRVAATRAAYGYLDSKTRWSNASTHWVYVLRDGDTPPNIQGFGGQAGLTNYVDPFVNDTTGEIDVAANQAIYLFELGTTPTGPAADYQDIVVLVSLHTQAQTVDTYTTTDGRTGIVCPTTP